MNLVYGLALHEFSVAQRTERLPGVWEDIGSDPLGDSFFFSLPHVRDMLIISFSHKLEVVTEILWKLEVRFKTELRKI